MPHEKAKTPPKKNMVIVCIIIVLLLVVFGIVWFYSSKDIIVDIFPPESTSSDITVKLNGEIVFQSQYVRNQTSSIVHPFFDTVNLSISGVDFKMEVKESLSHKSKQSSFSLLDGAYIQILIRDNIMFEQWRDRPQYE